MSYLSPLANSTKIAQSICKEGCENTVNTNIYINNNLHLNFSQSAKAISELKNSTLNDIGAIKGLIAEPNISCISLSPSTSQALAVKSSAKDSPRKSVGSRKSIGSRKVTAKKNVEPIKQIACNGTNVTVEKILKQINMTKYQQSFKKMDVAKFKELKEIDLNAIGITRPSEIKIFIEAIKKMKSDF